MGIGDWAKAFDKLENGRPHFRCVVNMKDFAEKKWIKKINKLHIQIKYNNLII